MSELADSNISMVNGVFIKEVIFREAGWIAKTHAHTYDHQTLLSVGALRITVDGKTADYHAPCIIVIQAGKHHQLEALSPSVAYCIHRMDGDVDDAEPIVQGVANAELSNLA